MDIDRRAMFTNTLIYFNIVSNFFRTMSSMCLSDGVAARRWISNYWSIYSVRRAQISQITLSRIEFSSHVVIYSSRHTAPSRQTVGASSRAARTTHREGKIKSVAMWRRWVTRKFSGKILQEFKCRRGSYQEHYIFSCQGQEILFKSLCN